MSEEPGKSVLRAVDDEARRLAKSLLRSARFAALGTLEADAAPAVSRVSLATTMSGEPVFLISQLSGHFANLDRDPRSSILVGEPGKGDPLAHPRLTIIGRSERLMAGEERGRLKGRYLMRHPKAALYADFADFAFWRMSFDRIFLNGGFGRAFALGANDLRPKGCSAEELGGIEADAVAHMNEDHAEAVQRYARMAGMQGTGWRLACIDSEGLDLARSDETARLWFPEPLSRAADLRSMLVALAKQ